ncbi:MAG TPA: phosphomannomutase/phosphoglucomutase [Phycisphaerae bacterium]|nr:phosphomannomutase/phosphoglucomutase [Phycisphaerae bacterium]HPS52354.1 phosphomannomutase/phosphoglucomutase [Phycisphaerae bacterium]
MSDIDKVFKAYDVRGIYAPGEIDEDLAWKIGHATAQFLHKSMSGYDRGQASVNKIVVGYDMRPHSIPLATALMEGIASSGATCINIGMCDTPMVYFAINHLEACGGIMVTASHNPIEYNGFKISSYKAKPVGSATGLNDIRDMCKNIQRTPAPSEATPVQNVDLWADYRKHVLKFLNLPRKLKVVVDASNGMGGRMIPAIFGGVKNLELVEMNFEMGKGFVHQPNPLVAANMKWVQDGVKANKADLGICLDGDADRCMFVDEKGCIIRCDIMTTWLAMDFLKDNPGATIVYDLRSSKILPEKVRACGGVPRRERVGHAFMKKAMADTQAVFGGELSGHSYFRDNFYADSGAIVFARAISVLSASDKPISTQVASLCKYSHSGEINFEVEDKEGKMKEIAQKFPDAEIDYLDGVTCTYPNWWCNVRPSNTEPLLRLSLEAETPALMKEKLAIIEKMLGKPVDH